MKIPKILNLSKVGTCLRRKLFMQAILKYAKMSSGCIMHSKPEIAQQSNKGQESIQDKKYSAEAGCDCGGQASGHSLFVQLQSVFAVVAQGAHALLKEWKRAVLNDLHFLRAILGSQKNRGICRDFPQILSLHT